MYYLNENKNIDGYTYIEETLRETVEGVGQGGGNRRGGGGGETK